MKTTSSHKSSAQLAKAIKNKKPCPVVKECTIEFFYYDQGAEVEVEGEVRFDDTRISVSYEIEDGGYVVYQGTEKGKGHYELRAPSINGRATLHMFDSSRILEGYWAEREEDDIRGMWRIRLC